MKFILAIFLMLSGFHRIIAFIRGMQYSQVVDMMPTSTIKSTDYGYVELFGMASQAGEFSLRDPIAHEPCLWFRVETYQIYRDIKGYLHKVQIKSAESSHPFLLKDSSGTCVVLPQGAVYTLMSTSMRDGKSIEHVVKRIRTGDKLCILGHIETSKTHAQTTRADSPDGEEDIKQRAREILMGWQQATAVLKNFDQNSDGILDASEVKRAQAAALYGAQVAIEREKPKGDVIDKVVRAPTDGRPFLISSHTPGELPALFNSSAIKHLFLAVISFFGTIFLFFL